MNVPVQQNQIPHQTLPRPSASQHLTGDDPNATLVRLSDVIDYSRVLTTHICDLIRARNIDKQTSPMTATLRTERHELWKKIEMLEPEAEIYKEQDTVPFECLADDPFSLPLLKGHDRPAYRLHRHHLEMFGPIFTRFSQLDKSDPLAEIAATTGVTTRTLYNWKEAYKADRM
jgi:hypothetical protein